MPPAATGATCPNCGEAVDDPVLVDDRGRPWDGACARRYLATHDFLSARDILALGSNPSN